MVARWAHNPKVVGSSPAPATKESPWKRQPSQGLLLYTPAPSNSDKNPKVPKICRPQPNAVYLSNPVGLYSFGLYPDCRDAPWCVRIDNQRVGTHQGASLQREGSPIRFNHSLNRLIILLFLEGRAGGAPVIYNPRRRGS